MSERPPHPRPEDFRYRREIEIRFRDLDGMGHVNNAVYLTYFELARLGYVRALGVAGGGDGPLDLFPFIMLDVHCRYVTQAVLSDVLVAHVRTASIGTKSFVFDYLVTRRGDGVVVATGRSTQVWYDYAGQRTLPVPQDFRDRVERLEGRAV